MAKKSFLNNVGSILNQTPTTEPDQLLADPPAARPSFGGDSVPILTNLSSEETSRLSDLETTIDKGLHTFLEVGNALLEIQESKLYRSRYLSFSQYMQARFGLARNRGYQLIEAAKVVNQIAEELASVSANAPTLPDNPIEGQTAETGYEAIPTGKVSRPSAGRTKPDSEVDLQDVEFTEHPTDGPDNQPPDEPPIPLPATESHAAALAQLPEAERATIWAETVKSSEQKGKPITAGSIKKTAEARGVPLNRKAPKDRQPPNNPFGRNQEPDDEFSEAAVDLTRQAMRSSEAQTESTESFGEVAPVDPADEDKPNEVRYDEDAVPVPVGSRQELTQRVRRGLQNHQPGEIMLIVKGSLLQRNGLAEAWQTLRGDDRPIDDHYHDSITLQEAYEMGILQPPAIE